MAKREVPEVNASSMADIAFLLLIFFLLVTTIDTDKGIIRKLPPMPEGDPPEVKENMRNVLVVLINSNDRLSVDGELMDVSDLRDKTKLFVKNPFNDKSLSESPQKAVVSLKNDRGTSYDMYITVQNELTAAYNELRDEEANNLFGRNYQDLTKNQQREVKDVYPMKISEAEPEDIGGGS